MSDQTSDTSTELDNGSSEPSMEDILASIRRIIAEDDSGDHGHVDFGDDSANAADFTDSVSISSAVPEDDVLILDALLDESSKFDIDSSLVIPEPSSQVVDDLEFNPVSNVVLDLEAKLGYDRDTVSKAPETEASQSDGLDDIDLVLTDEFSSEFEALEVDVATSDTENELDGIRDDILQIFDDSDADEDLSIDLPIADETSAIDDDAIEILSLDDDMDDEGSTDFDIAAESDLDLVKSLMADLTDTSFMDETAETEADSDAEMSLDDMLQEFSDEVEPENAAISDDTDGEQDQILTDILDMAIQGEEDQNDFGNLDLTMDDAPSGAEADSDNPFLQIAAMAEADAASTEAETFDEIAQLEPSAPKETAEDILNEFDLALLDNSDEELDADVDELSDDISTIEESSEDQDSADMVDFFIEPQEDLTEETEDMAKTARKDTILDEVTETATTDAFASLSQVVEQKAVFTESGPRVGDLVQEALRPMLKEWLDENLKGIVERAVAKEVKRISSGK